MIRKQLSSNIIHLGILQDCAWTWKQLWWRIQHYPCPCRVGILQEMCLDETTQFYPESFHNTWIMTWNYRRKIKIQIDTFTHKTETKSSGSIPTLPSVPSVSLFLLQSFRALDTFPKARSATWSTLRTQTRRVVRRVSRRRVGGMVFQLGHRS